MDMKSFIISGRGISKKRIIPDAKTQLCEAPKSSVSKVRLEIDSFSSLFHSFSSRDNPMKLTSRRFMTDKKKYIT